MAVPGLPFSITRRIAVLSAMARYSGLPIATVNAPCPSTPWHPEQFCAYNTRKSATSFGRTAGGSATLRSGDPHDARSMTARIDVTRSRAGFSHLFSPVWQAIVPAGGPSGRRPTDHSRSSLISPASCFEAHNEGGEIRRVSRRRSERPPAGKIACHTQSGASETRLLLDKLKHVPGSSE